MALKPRFVSNETQKRRVLHQRMAIVHGFFLIVVLMIVARLMELQVVRGADYRQQANLQHFGDVTLPAKRGEILALNSKSGGTNILATNTTLDLLYVDPLIAKPVTGTDHTTDIAETLSDILLTDEVHNDCVQGNNACPSELVSLMYGAAFDPLQQQKLLQSGSLLEPLAPGQPLPPQLLNLPDASEARRLFARNIEERISQNRVTFSPLKYGANKVQMKNVQALAIPGITVSEEQKLIYANPENIAQNRIDSLARKLANALEMDPSSIRGLLRSRALRYVPIMRKLSPAMSLRIREAQLKSYKEAEERRRQQAAKDAKLEFDYSLRSIALLPEHWRLYPDTTIASHVIGFLRVNAPGESGNEEGQYGIERAFNPQLKGQEGVISSVKDLAGGQILTPKQTIVKPRDGDTIVLTIDRTIQKEVEQLMNEAVEKYNAETGQAIVMEPDTGRILAMVNAPLFDSNNYAEVYRKEPFTIDDPTSKRLVVELYDPDTNARLVKAYYKDVFTQEGRETLAPKLRKIITDLEKLYDLKDLTRYYWYVGEDANSRQEVFPTEDAKTWLRFQNTIGVGAYLNRTIQSIYEPGSTMKPITMAIAIDQGELSPSDTYSDLGPVKVDEFEIKNALNRYYGRVTMTNCLEFSINTCMTAVSSKLGPKLFHRALESFGFGRITGIELEDELTGELRPWRKRGDWSNSLLATSSYGQGISVTPLQMTTAFSALANKGILMRPTIIDRIIHSDGTEEVSQPTTIDRVITERTADTVTSMLISSIEKGYASAGGVKGYYLAGKTGTSQIAGPGGKYETGTGSTITSFIGYGPARNPRFLVYVKFDRPTRDVYGSSTAVPVFHDIAAFLLKYYGIPPER
jgi:cell division protein FtsI/penicillin-binding protein 2